MTRPAPGDAAEPRVVSLIASATEIVAALGFEERIVGRSHECDYPPSVRRLPACSSSEVDTAASSRLIDTQVRDIVARALSVYRVDPEQLDGLAPSLIVTQTQCEVCAVSLAEVERAVSELVVSSPRVLSLEPMQLDDVWLDIASVAAALDEPERGDRLVGRLRERLDEIRQRVDRVGRRPTIACIEWIDPLMYAANWVPELVRIAGGEGVTGDVGGQSGYFSIEQLEAMDPEVIAIMPCGFDIERSRREMPALVARPEWRRLRAVREGRVHITDGNQYFNRPGPRLVESAEILAELLHPGAVDYGHEGTGWQRLD